MPFTTCLLQLCYLHRQQSGKRHIISVIQSVTFLKFSGSGIKRQVIHVINSVFPSQQEPDCWVTRVTGQPA